MRNPVDYSQSMMYPENVHKTIDIVSRWDGMDFLVKFVRTGQASQMEDLTGKISEMMGGFLRNSGVSAKPVAVVIEPSMLPEEARLLFTYIQECVSLRLPVYYSFASAASAINVVLSYSEHRPGKLEKLL